MGKQLEIMFDFERDFVPYILTLNKICMLRKLLPLLKPYVSKEEVRQIRLLVEVLRKSSELMQKRNH